MILWQEIRVKKEEFLWLAAIWFYHFVGMNIEFEEAQLQQLLEKTESHAQWLINLNSFKVTFKTYYFYLQHSIRSYGSWIESPGDYISVIKISQNL